MPRLSWSVLCGVAVHSPEVLFPTKRVRVGSLAGDFLAHTASCTGKPVPVDSKTFGAKQRNNGAQGAQMNLNSPDRTDACDAKSASELSHKIGSRSTNPFVTASLA
ncbi:hypothetical protein GQ600_7680 [Phytophthora cactorum]|nr:hypothetical protein GQ600_7680 [Phytophthora cactorum]